MASESSVTSSASECVFRWLRSSFTPFVSSCSSESLYLQLSELWSPTGQSSDRRGTCLHQNSSDSQIVIQCYLLILVALPPLGESADAYGWQRSEWRTSRECSTGAADTSFAVAGDVGCPGLNWAMSDDRYRTHCSEANVSQMVELMAPSCQSLNHCRPPTNET